jgi:hypothetical protein
MIARPKISQNERKTTEIGAFEVGNFAPFYCPGISVRHHGSYFPKRSRGWDYPQRPQLLALENPDDASLDVGKNSFAMTRVKRAFEHAHAKLALACCGDDWRAACLLGSAVDATVLNPRVASSLEATT